MKRASLMSLGLAVAAAVCAAGANGPQAPVTVSPGTSTGARIGDNCPTFSWGAVPGARAYELVVYRLGQGDEEPEALLRQKLPGSASGWTPSLERCFERGGRYAWSVRAQGKETASVWSAPAFFQVAARPSEGEFEAALQVVRRYLTAQPGTVPSQDVVPVGSRSESKSVGGSSQPVTRSVGTTQLSVDGGIVAGSFTGDGSTLTGLDPGNLAAGTAGISISGNAATATDADTLDGMDSTEFSTGAHTTDTNAGTLCASDEYLDGAGTCKPVALIDTTCNGISCNGTNFWGVTAFAGDSATAFFTTGQIEEPRIADEIARDSEVLAADSEVLAALGKKTVYLTDTRHNGANALTACATGYHMASQWEIPDPLELVYDNSAPGAFTGNDRAGGLPMHAGGWIRTGGPSEGYTTIRDPNCWLWTDSSATFYGSEFNLNGVSVSTGWSTFHLKCNDARRVWCVAE